MIRPPRRSGRGGALTRTDSGQRIVNAQPGLRARRGVYFHPTPSLLEPSLREFQHQILRTEIDRVMAQKVLRLENGVVSQSRAKFQHRVTIHATQFDVQFGSRGKTIDAHCEQAEEQRSKPIGLAE